MTNWLKSLPKAELHLHIEGTLEPEKMFELAARNGVDLPYESVADLRAAYDFDDLSSFLSLYFQGMEVLQTEADFYELTMDYLGRASAEGVVHVELSFDPQAHLVRGIELGTPLAGLTRAMTDAEHQHGISSALIMSFLRDRDADEALNVLEQSRPWHDWIAAVGLDSAESGNPPTKFAQVFERARQLGLPRVAHAGEEGPADYVRGALDTLDVCRVDHGVRAVDDPDLLDRLKCSQTPLTVCPLSNVYLNVVDQLVDHPLPQLIEHGLNVTINSDDPAYFGGGMLNNLAACAEAFDWQRETCRDVARNAVRAAFMGPQRRQQLLSDIDNC
ncbi:adenosine deaminase [Salinisphaera orenii]|uniref:adenosine deaminase n=1 Tax=Salinisphaera orenii TaxID=856731 RepID=UPI000DBE6FBD